MDDHRALKRANWDERAPAHAKSPDYALARFLEDPKFISGVVPFDLPLLGNLEGVRGVHLGQMELLENGETVWPIARGDWLTATPSRQSRTPRCDIDTRRLGHFVAPCSGDGPGRRCDPLAAGGAATGWRPGHGGCRARPSMPVGADLPPLSEAGLAARYDPAAAMAAISLVSEQGFTFGNASSKPGSTHAP